jgi:peptidyl-prolyl cis-trans isomerase B (cyclophilin B)
MRTRPAGVLTALALSLALAACGGSDDGDEASDVTTPSAEQTSETSTDPGTEDSSSGTSEPAAGEVPCAYAPDGTEAPVSLPPANAASTGTPVVDLTTSIGDLTFTLDAAQAPCTVNSFVSLVEQGFYDGTTCHRLTTQGIFVLQCGDPTATGTGGPGYGIPDEFPPAPGYGPGTLAMAKTPMPNSGGSQFFIVYDGPETQLPPEYTIFGTVSEGIDLVADAAAEGTVDGAPDGSPKVPVDIETATVG